MKVELIGLASLVESRETSIFPIAGISGINLPGFSFVGAGDQTRVLILGQQALYQLIFLPNG